MYYKDVEEEYPSYEFGSASKADIMTWMKTPMGIVTVIAIVALLIFIIYWFFFKKASSSSQQEYSYY